MHDCVGFTEKVLARFNKTFQASLSRVANGTTSGEFEIRSLRVNQYSGSGSSTTYETYFDPSATTVGVGSVNFILTSVSVALYSIVPVVPLSE